MSMIVTKETDPHAAEKETGDVQLRKKEYIKGIA